MSDKLDTRNHPAVKALASHQERLGLSNKPFARRYLRSSDATWSTLKEGKYPARDVTKWLERCEGALRLIEDELGAVGAETGALLDLSDQRAVITAVRECAKEERNRLVVFLGDTGAGKTMLGRRLRQIYLDQCVPVEASETWRDSYYAPVLALAETLGVPEADCGTKRTAEAAVVEALAVAPRIIALDEGHYCGTAALNLVKLLLNKTMSRVVVMAMPQLWQRMAAKSWEETRQLRNRTHAKVVMTGVSAADCRAFLAARLPGYAGLNGSEKEVVADCRAAANRFGLLNTLQGICDEVATEAHDGEASLDIVRAAISRVEALRS